MTKRKRTTEAMDPGTCSTTSLMKQEEKNNVLIHYPVTDPLTKDVMFKFIRLSVDQVINPYSCEKRMYQQLSESFLTPQTNCAYTSRSRGGLCLHLFCCNAEPEATPNNNLLYKVYRYKVSETFKHVDINECRNMPHGMGSSLVVKVDDHIYLLSYVERPMDILDGDDGLLEPVFQRYNLKDDYWEVVRNSSTALIKLRSHENFAYSTINRAPHVVIGSKLHLSLGESTFTFDTTNGVWEKCKLFETFWSNQESRNTTFGFSGKGILFGEDILLGVNHTPNCPLVAFRLNGTDGERVVVQSQCITTNELAPLTNKLESSGARLIDLGRDCYFGLVHLFNASTRRMLLTIFQVERVEGDASRFLKCEFISKEFLDENLPSDIENFYVADCV